MNTAKLTLKPDEAAPQRVFLYEFISGGGCFHPSIDEPPSGTLLQEGLAMWRAAYEDLSRISNVEVVTTRDARLSMAGELAIPVDQNDPQLFTDLARRCDAALVIAPEFDGHLENLVRQVEEAGCRLLGTDSSFVRRAANKQATLESLVAAGVSVPHGQLLQSGKLVPRGTKYPVVAKHNDGAGSMGRVLDIEPDGPFDKDMRLEEFLSGTSCSQSFLCCGDQPAIACPPMEQWIARDGSLQYLGGERMQSQPLVERASSLAEKVVLAFPNTRGYVGVDMILGNAPDGSEDCVLEVNPRLTTSYIGLRHLTDDNLMQMLLDIATGARPSIGFNSKPVRFWANGTLET